MIYPRKLPGQSNDYYRLLWTTLAVLFVLSMVIQPRIAFDGAVMGLKTWWNIVFPSLLPFFIASELLMSFGVVHFMGVLLEPVMRPLFNVPGAGSFVMAVGFSSGYPIGSMVTARLRSQGLCTRVEAERLMSFTNNSSPLFMLVAVAVGMFNNPALGWIIAGAHYLSNITLGFILRFHARNDVERIPEPSAKSSGLIGHAFRQLLQVQRQDNRPLGKIIGDAVRNAVTNLLNIGGFIILFAVIIKMLTAAGFINSLASCLGVFLLPLGFSPEILPALASGFFEMTIGSKLASETTVPLLQQVVAVGMILAWSGLSVHAQAASMISDTDIRMHPFIITRVAHCFLAGLYSYIIFQLCSPLEPATAAMATVAKWQNFSFIMFNLKLFGLFIISLVIIILIALMLNLVSNIKILTWKNK
ncbi:sporulation integral membrane protein YlbJ [Pelotomaculum isophthalicicum JI]|uniref:Sporulation integral membrane protein YlbJ n=1 Tax=Pelotomaculum isophthalicicum JI TaxID=947010 RepID=A0A9X4JT43_9FIRM|nr:sporulation integral membrane protein YlbJ [Pelotomaculum isophthalicicum]MDF9408109.1 sporulation integral membrane protein YlbJ [Pelotomaculum isophthalicicum JI]